MNANKINPFNIKWSVTPIVTLFSLQGLAVNSPANTSDNVLASYSFDPDLFINQGTELIIKAHWTLANTALNKTPGIVYGATTVFAVASATPNINFFTETRIRNMDDNNLLYYNFYIQGSTSFGSQKGTLLNTAGTKVISAKGQSDNGAAADLQLNAFSIQLANYGGF